MGPDFLETALKDLSENQAPLPLKMPQTLQQLLTSAHRRTLVFCVLEHTGERWFIKLFYLTFVQDEIIP